MDGVSSSLLLVTQGIPQGSVLGPLFFFIICINTLSEHNVSDHFYAGDTVLYCSAPSLQQALIELQLASALFNTICQNHIWFFNKNKTNDLQ